MVIKLEYVLIFIIFLIVLFTTTIKVTDTIVSKEQSLKELEFFNAQFIEVDQNGINSIAYSTKGIRDNGILSLLNLIYYSKSIDSLFADEAQYNNIVMYLSGNVRLKDLEGHTYTTNEANYNKKTQVLNITKPFVSHIFDNIIKGNTLTYHTINKEANATHIDAVFYPKKQ